MSDETDNTLGDASFLDILKDILKHGNDLPDPPVPSEPENTMPQDPSTETDETLDNLEEVYRPEMDGYKPEEKNVASDKPPKPVKPRDTGYDNETTNTEKFIDPKNIG